MSDLSESERDHLDHLMAMGYTRWEAFGEIQEEEEVKVDTDSLMIFAPGVPTGLGRVFLALTGVIYAILWRLNH